MTDGFLNNFKSSKNRLLIFDYDGVLAPLINDPSPSASRPAPSTVQLLESVASKPGTHLYIVSGRPKSALEDWFSSAPSIGLSAEHGAWQKINGAWQKLVEPFPKLKTTIRQAMEKSAKKTPGSLVEAKDFAVVWHFRAARDQQQALLNAAELQAELEKIVQGTDLGVYLSAETGKILEVKPRAINKGSVVKKLIAKHQNPEFIAVFGDDYTDEHAFMACPSQAWTVKVGKGNTSARQRLPNVAAVFDLLQAIKNL